MKKKAFLSPYELNYESNLKNTVVTKKKLFTRDDKKSYLMLLLPLLWWGVFFVYAFVMGVYYSFTDLTYTPENITVFFTFDNYVRLAHDGLFWKSLGNTLIWTLAMTIANNGLGLLFAYLITRMKKGQKLFLTLLFWPTLVSAVASAEITKIVFSPSENGLMNIIIKFFGGTPLAWYNDKNLALLTLMLMPLLLGFSSQMIIYYVAIKGVDQSQVEAAKIDGARSGKIFRKIYVPSIKQAINYNVILSIIGGVRVMAPMQLIVDNPLIAGGPDGATSSVVLMLYQNILSGERAYACAIGVITTIIIVLLSIAQRKVSGNKEGL